MLPIRIRADTIFMYSDNLGWIRKSSENFFPVSLFDLQKGFKGTVARHLQPENVLLIQGPASASEFCSSNWISNQKNVFLSITFILSEYEGKTNFFVDPPKKVYLVYYFRMQSVIKGQCQEIFDQLFCLRNSTWAPYEGKNDLAKFFPFREDIRYSR